MSNNKILKIEGLSIQYKGDTGIVNAVKSVNLDIAPGEVLGIVGESGCGKSSLAMSVMRLLNEKQTNITGKIKYDGKDILTMTMDEVRKIRGQGIAMIIERV